MSDQKQKKYLELQSLEQHLQQLQQQAQMLQQQVTELLELANTLEEFTTLKKDAAMFVGLGNGIYANAELKEVKSVLMTVGAGVVVKKTVPVAKKNVEEQAAEIQKILQAVQEQMQKAIARAQELQKELAAEKN